MSEKVVMFSPPEKPKYSLCLFKLITNYITSRSSLILQFGKEAGNIDTLGEMQITKYN